MIYLYSRGDHAAILSAFSTCIIIDMLLCTAVRGNTTTALEESAHLAETDAAGETTNTTGTTINREKQSTHKFNEVRQRAYVLGARGERFY